MFCINKFADNRVAIEYLNKTTRPRILEIISQLQSENNLFYLDTNYIFDAIEAIINLRRALKYCYAD